MRSCSARFSSGQGTNNDLGNFVLNLEYVLKLSIVTFRPDMIAAIAVWKGF
ncbi:MAG: hypothetical protein VB959_01895 [Rhodospirillales bacterium]|jgi:hypothetical protein